LDISPPTDSAARVCSGDISPEAALLLRFKTHSEKCGYNAHTMAMNLSALRQFLSYLEQRNITAGTVQPSDVASFLRMRLRKFCCLPPLGTESASCSIAFSKLNSPDHRYLCLRFKRHLAMSPVRLEARMDSLLSFPVGLFHPPTCRFIPALSGLPTTRSESVECEAQRRKFDSLYAAASNG
jgi:hypothetical protein